MYSTSYFKKYWPKTRVLGLTLILSWVLSITLQAQFKVVHASDSILSLKKAGLLYCLPQAKLQIRLHVNKTSHTKGLYAANAKEMLGIEPSFSESGNEYTIERVWTATTAIPDPSHYYLLSFNKCGFHKKAVLYLSPESFLLSLNRKIKSCEDKEDGSQFACEMTERMRALDAYTYHLNPNLFKAIPADTTPFPKYFFKVKSTDDPAMKGARDAAENLARIKENKINLLSGYQEIAYEKSTFDAMLNGLEAEEEKALSLFTGTTDVTCTWLEIPVVPEETDTLPIVIGHFSNSAGFSQNPTAEGKPVTLTLLPLKNFGAIPEKSQKKARSKSGKGLVLRQPAWVTAEIRIANELVYSENVCLPQFGYIERLPLSTKEAIFDNKTGAVQFYR